MSNKDALLFKQKHRCFYCLIQLGSPKKSKRKATKDHIITKSIISFKGITHLKDNIVMACQICNQSKSSKIIKTSFMEKRHQLFAKVKGFNSNLFDVEDKLWNQTEALDESYN